MTEASPGPLAGLTIYDLSTYVAGPSATLTMAQLGAEVIRIDPIGGATDTRRLPLDPKGTSLYWIGLNKAKKSVEIDTSSPEGRELVAALVTAPGPGNGIMVTNAVGQRWLSYETMRERRDDVIVVHIAGRRDGRPAVDYTVNCEVGLPYVTGPVDFDRPVNHVLPAWDLLTGLHAALAVLAAERVRSNTGKGQLVTVALADVAVAAMANLGFVADVVVNGRDRLREGNFLYGSFGCDFPTADGQRVMIVALTERHWHNLVELTGLTEIIAALQRSLQADLALEEVRYQYREVLEALLRPWFAQRSLDEVKVGLESSKVLWGVYRTVHDLVINPESLLHRTEVMVDVEQPGIGTFPVPRSVLGFSEWDDGPPQPAATLGEHTDEVVGSVLGLTDAALGDLRERGVIEGAGPMSDWKPTEEVAYDTLSETAAAALHGLLDAPGEPPHAGDPVPPLWHWLTFLPKAPDRDIGVDGHPRVGGFLPPQAVGRRMFGGAQYVFHQPVAVAGPLRRTAVVSSIEEKTGRTGHLLLVTIHHEITCDGVPAFTETHDVVYRAPVPASAEVPAAAPGPAAAPAASAAPTPPAPEVWDWEIALKLDPTLLFRYSALTYNAHRIHYDRPYTTEVEGYPGLVVQGPLQAITLAELCRRHLPDRPLTAFRFRSVRPAFDVGGVLRCCGRLASDDQVTLSAFDSDGFVTMEATATLSAS